jgi:hypothetical protein
MRLVIEKQPWKALSPILVTESGIDTDTKLVQPWKAPSPILVQESGIDTCPLSGVIAQSA